MKSIGYAVLALLLWWAMSMIIIAGGTPLLQHGTLPRGDAFVFAVPMVLFLGSIFAVPIVLYLAVADALARRFAFPRNVIVYLLLLVVGSAPLSLFRSVMSGYEIRTAFNDPEWVMIPTVVVAALYLIRQFRRRAAVQAV